MWKRPWPPLSLDHSAAAAMVMGQPLFFFKHLIFLLSYSCTVIKPGSVVFFGEHCLLPRGAETDLQPAYVGHAWPICLEQAHLSNKLTERKQQS